VSFWVKRARWRVSGTLRSARPDHCAGLGAEVLLRELAEVVVVHVAGGRDHDARFT